MFEQMDLNLPATAPANLAALRTPVKVFQCPSAPPARTTDFLSPIPNLPPGSARRATTDYAPVLGVDGLLEPFLPPGTPVNAATGVLMFNLPRRMDESTDGASNTILVAEDAGRPQWWQKGVELPMDQYGIAPGGGWGDAHNAFVIDGLLNADERSVCTVNGTNQFAICGFHTDGANVLAADGSVHFLPEALTSSP